MPSDHEAPSSASARRRGQTLETGQVLGGRYVITDFIGAGGMGAVYGAKHLRTGRALALKVLLPEFAAREDLMQRFMAEARSAGALNHPGIVEVVDLDRQGDLHFIVMEMIEGEELYARMQREPVLDPAFVARIGADIADAISCAHLNTPKIVHRDLKPQNVLLARKGRQRDIVKILDFGIAKLVQDGGAHSLTRSGEIYGTPLYMSPEQLRNSKDVDERTDIYAIGVILFHALTGVTPFRGESFPDLVISISTETPPPVRTLRPDVPAGLAAVVERAMARNKNDRHPSALSLRNALLPFAGEVAPISAPDMLAATQSLEPSTAKAAGVVTEPARSRRVPLVAVIAVGAIVAAGLGLALSRRAPAPATSAAPAPEARAMPAVAPAAPVAVPAPPPAAPAVAPPAAAPAASAAAAPVAPVAVPRNHPPRKPKRTDGDALPALRPR